MHDVAGPGPTGTRAGVGFIAGDAHPELARAIAAASNATLVPASVTTFADGELRVEIGGTVRDLDLYIVQPTQPPVGEHLMALALLAEAARSAGAARVTALVPYFGFARQDVCAYPGAPRAAQLAARLLRCAGVDRLVTLELHSPALESAFEMPVLNVRADDLLLPEVRAWNIPKLTVVAPDAGGLKRAQRYAAALDTPLAAVAKIRAQADSAAAFSVLGEVNSRNCVIIDDMASTGGTIVAAARALIEAGAQQVHAVFVHAIMAPGALERICAAPVTRLLTTDSVPVVPAARLQVKSIAPLLAGAVAAMR